MLKIKVYEFVNGFGVRIEDDRKENYDLNEVHEERLEALKAVERYLRDEIIRELERRQQNASIM